MLAERTGGYFTGYPGGVLDPSGAVKGWAVERASDLLTAAGARAHAVNGCGDMQLVGEPAPGQVWRVGIAHPLRPGTLATTVCARDIAVATSGPAERGNHIIDPHTGAAAAGIASLTVVGPRLGLVDAYATAACARGIAGLDWVEQLDGYEAFAVLPDGDTRSTSGFASRVTTGGGGVESKSG